MLNAICTFQVPICVIRLCDQIYLEVITRLFSYRPVSNRSVENCTRCSQGQLLIEGLIVGRYENNRVTSSLSCDQTIRQGINYFMCCNRIVMKVTDEWLIVYCGVYTALALAATTNQRYPLLSMTYGNSKLSSAVYRCTRTVITPTGISIYNRTLLTITTRC